MQGWEVRTRKAGQLLADFNGVTLSPEGYNIAHFTTADGRPQSLDSQDLQIMSQALHEEMQKNPQQPWPIELHAAHNQEIDLLYECLLLMTLRRAGYLCDQPPVSSSSYKQAGRMARQILGKQTLKGELK